MLFCCSNFPFFQFFSNQEVGNDFVIFALFMHTNLCKVKNYFIARGFDSLFWLLVNLTVFLSRTTLNPICFCVIKFMMRWIQRYKLPNGKPYVSQTIILKRINRKDVKKRLLELYPSAAKYTTSLSNLFKNVIFFNIKLRKLVESPLWIKILDFYGIKTATSYT